MKKGQVFEGTVDYIDFPNKGRLTVDGEKVSVKDVIPGQKIKACVNKVRSGKYEARLLEILERSPLETGERCEHFGKCGGCIYQPIPYAEQLKIKEAQIKKLLDDVCDDYVFEGIKASPIHEEYRNKMEFSFGDEVKDGPLSLGMHKKGSFHDIVTVSGCRIVDSDFRTILTATKDFFAERNIPFYKKMQQVGYLRHLLVRKAKKTGEILVDIVTTTQIEDSALMQDYKDMLLGLYNDGRLHGGFVGILHTYNDSLADAVINEKTVVLHGKDFFFEELNGLIFKITPFSFFQTNSLGAEVLYDTAKSYIGDTNDKIVYDLYSGTGTIAQMMASAAKKVVGVEIVEEAVEAAKMNATLNGLTNCEFIAGDVLKVIDDIEEKPDLLMLDPPRDGINPKALPKLAAYGVPRIVYISCKASSLARDIVLFKENGYKLVKAVAVDMFPGTANIESVALLVKE